MTLAKCQAVVARCSAHGLWRLATRGTRRALGADVADRTRDPDVDRRELRLDSLVYLLWAGVLLALLRYL